MGLGEKLIRARGAGIPWAQKTGMQRFFTIAGPIIYIAWGLFLVLAAIVAGMLSCAFENNKPRRRRWAAQVIQPVFRDRGPSHGQRTTHRP